MTFARSDPETVEPGRPGAGTAIAAGTPSGPALRLIDPTAQSEQRSRHRLTPWRVAYTGARSERFLLGLRC